MGNWQIICGAHRAPCTHPTRHEARRLRCGMASETGYPASMWNVVLIGFAALAVVGSLLLGWPIVIAILIAVVVVGVWAATGALQGARGKPSPPGTAQEQREISEVRDYSEAGPAETPSSTR